MLKMVAKSLQGMAISVFGTRLLSLGGTQHNGTPVLSEALVVNGTEKLIIAPFSLHVELL